MVASSVSWVLDSMNDSMRKLNRSLDDAYFHMCHIQFCVTLLFKNGVFVAYDDVSFRWVVVYDKRKAV